GGEGGVSAGHDRLLADRSCGGDSRCCTGSVPSWRAHERDGRRPGADPQGLDTLAIELLEPAQIVCSLEPGELLTGKNMRPWGDLVRLLQGADVEVNFARKAVGRIGHW